jgi:hypothetical protein
MKKVADAAADANAAGPGWFKIMAQDYDSGTGQWCTEKLRATNGLLSILLPVDLAGGYYLLRPELLALQQADKIPADPQFYIGCAQIYLNSSGAAVPLDTVDIPGYVDMVRNKAAMTFDIYDRELALPYPMFGPPVYRSGQVLTNSADALSSPPPQTKGLAPQGCILENDNWCGVEVPAYRDELGCWAVRTSDLYLRTTTSNSLTPSTTNHRQSSLACGNQTASCYSSAGPTGSKNCHIWEAKCTRIRNGCNAGDFEGPPDAGAILTPERASIVAPAVFAASSNQTTPLPEGPAGPVVQSTGGSVDQCGGGEGGGQVCATGLCCSGHG